MSRLLMAVAHLCDRTAQLCRVQRRLVTTEQKSLQPFCLVAPPVERRSQGRWSKDSLPNTPPSGLLILYQPSVVWTFAWRPCRYLITDCQPPSSQAATVLTWICY